MMNINQSALISQTNNNKVQAQKPYTVMKYQEAYISASNKLIEFFTVPKLQKYINFDSKTKFQKQLMGQILTQLREFLRKKAAKQFENMINKPKTENCTLKMEQKFQIFDELFIKNMVMNQLASKSAQLKQANAFQVPDIQDQILNQLQFVLAKTYAQL